MIFFFIFTKIIRSRPLFIHTHGEGKDTEKKKKKIWKAAPLYLFWVV